MTTKCSSGDTRLDIVVNKWLQWDKNEQSRHEVIEDIEHSRWEKLKKTMLSRQKFGTAGLRGKMAAGFNNMNDVVVIQTAQGLCSYLKKLCSKSQLSSGVVVGYDGRYNSKRFAELTAKVFITASVPVHMFYDVCPTPLVAFATMFYGSAAGIMVTASHNPKEDNGYKVYWGNGSQIIAPHDNNIIEEILNCLDIPDEHWNIDGIRSSPLVTDCLEEVVGEYLQYIKSELSDKVLEDNKSSRENIVYSAMHGVGYKYILRAFEAASLQPPISVVQQQEPDPEFPTVKFPNPEEIECVELSRALAESKRVKLVLINDPDADRLAVAEYDVSADSLRVFSGNEMGALLGGWLLQQHRAKASGCGEAELVFIASLVSSSMLKSVAQAEGCQFVHTLTGFKWMGNTTLLLAKEGKLPLFAFEEAIGYMCSHRVPDKDGISAAVQVASLAMNLYKSGSSLAKRLQEMYAQYGYHVSYNSYYLCHEPAVIKSIFRRIRNYGESGGYPKEVNGLTISSVRDLAAGVKIPDQSFDEHSHSLSTVGTGLDREYTGGEMVMFSCTNGLSVTIRTSGTEPKIKFYTELVQDAAKPEEQEKVKSELVEMARNFVNELLQPKENGLIV